MAPPKSFFMFCFTDDFATRLSVPSGFVEAHALHRRRELTLRLKTAPAARRSWAVKIKKIDGVFYITDDGWAKFVADNGLQLSKLLVFHIANDSTLHVAIYGLDACLELPPSPSSDMQKRPSYYKILMDIPPLLGLPEGFMRKHGMLFPRKVKLRNGCGGRWEVRIGEVDDDGYFFTEGWKEFCQDMGLKVFELLLFSYAGNATFDVSVYAGSALEKASDLLASRSRHPPSFVKWKIYHHCKFHVPAQLAKASGLEGKKKLLLEYSPDGQSSVVKLNSCEGRFSFGSGWSQFCIANRLTRGRTYSFEFVPMKNAIRVQPYSH